MKGFIHISLYLAQIIDIIYTNGGIFNSNLCQEHSWVYELFIKTSMYLGQIRDTFDSNRGIFEQIMSHRY